MTEGPWETSVSAWPVPFTQPLTRLGRRVLGVGVPTLWKLRSCPLHLCQPCLGPGAPSQHRAGPGPYSHPPAPPWGRQASGWLGHLFVRTKVDLAIYGNIGYELPSPKRLEVTTVPIFLGHLTPALNPRQPLPPNRQPGQRWRNLSGCQAMLGHFGPLFGSSQADPAA